MKIIHKISLLSLCLSTALIPFSSVIASADQPYTWHNGKLSISEIIDGGLDYEDYGMFDGLSPKGINHNIRIYTSKNDDSSALYLVYQVGLNMTYQQLYFDHDVLYYNSAIDTNSILEYLDSEYAECSFDIKNQKGTITFESEKELNFKQKLDIATKLYKKFDIVPEISIYESTINVPIDVWNSGGFSFEELNNGGEEVDDKGLLKSFSPKDVPYEVRYYSSESSGRSALFIVYSFDGLTTYQQLEINDNVLTYLKKDPVSGKEIEFKSISEYISTTYKYKTNENADIITFSADQILTPKEKLFVAAEIYEKYAVIPEISVYENSLTLPVKGNANGDKNIDVTDIAVLSAHIKGIKPLSYEQQYAADIDGNNELSVTDIALIASHIKGIKPLE